MSTTPPPSARTPSAQTSEAATPPADPIRNPTEPSASQAPGVVAPIAREPWFMRNRWLTALLIVFGTLFLRVIDFNALGQGRFALTALEAWPFVHDEAIHADFALKNVFWVVGTTATPREYDPVYHGPLQYYLVATSFVVNGVVQTGLAMMNGEFEREIQDRIAANVYVSSGPTAMQYNQLVRDQIAHRGTSDTAARMPSLIFGCVLCALPLAFARRLGPWVTATACVMLIVATPTLSYYSRIVLYDIMCVTVEFAAIACIFAAARLRDWRLFVLGAFFIGCDLILKPSSIIFLANLFIIVFIEIGFALVLRSRRNVLEYLALVRYRDTWFIVTGCVFIILSMWALFYTNFGKHPQHVVAVDEMIHHWWEIHGIERLAGSPWYYLSMIIIYDPIRVLGLLVALYLILFSREPVLRFFALWSWGAFCAYWIAGEKGPWLINHFIAPATIPAAWMVGNILRRAFRSRKPLREVGWAAVAGVIAVLVLYQVHGQGRLMYVLPAWDAANPYQSVQAQRLANERARERGEPEPYPVVHPDRWELMSYVSTTYDFARAMKQAQIVANTDPQTGKRSNPGIWVSKPRVLVGGDPTWPAVWYLREGVCPPNSISYDISLSNAESFDLLIVGDGPLGEDPSRNLASELSTRLADTHDRIDIPLRAWWTAYFIKHQREILDEAERAEVNKLDGLRQMLAINRIHLRKTLENFYPAYFLEHVLHRYVYEPWNIEQLEQAKQTLEASRPYRLDSAEANQARATIANYPPRVIGSSNASVFIRKHTRAASPGGLHGEALP